jgi:hypothetical protein
MANVTSRTRVYNASVIEIVYTSQATGFRLRCRENIYVRIIHFMVEALLNWVKIDVLRGDSKILERACSKEQG